MDNSDEAEHMSYSNCGVGAEIPTVAHTVNNNKLNSLSMLSCQKFEKTQQSIFII